MLGFGPLTNQRDDGREGEDQRLTPTRPSMLQIRRLEATTATLLQRQEDDLIARAMAMSLEPENSGAAVAATAAAAAATTDKKSNAGAGISAGAKASAAPASTSTPAPTRTVTLKIKLMSGGTKEVTVPAHDPSSSPSSPSSSSGKQPLGFDSRALATAVAAATGVPASEQRLIFRGKIIKARGKGAAAASGYDPSDDVGRCYGVREGDSVHLAPTKKGKARASAAAAAAAAATSTANAAMTATNATATSATSTASSTTAALRTALSRFGRRGAAFASAPAAAAAGLSLLRKYVANVASKPLEPKFRRINRGNRAMVGRVLSQPGADDVIRVGFVWMCGEG